MSIVVQCEGCQKRYQVGDERAGTRAKCKACGAVLNIPALAEVEAGGGASAIRMPPPVAPRIAPLPPPLASRAMPSPPPMAPPALATPYANPYPQSAATAQKSNTGLIVGIVVGFVVLLMVVGGVAAFRAMPPATFMSDATLQTKLAGRWNLSHSASGPAMGSITFKSDGTYRAHLNTGGKIADFSGPFTIKSHLITLTIATVHFGNKSAVGQQIPLGSIKDVNDAKLVLGTKYGDEIYQKP